MDRLLLAPQRAGMLVQAKASTSARPAAMLVRAQLLHRTTSVPFQPQRVRPQPLPLHPGENAPHGAQVVCKGVADYSAYPSAPELPPDRMGDAARRALARATGAVRRYGWMSFWAQLTLSVIGGVILLFSVAFTSQSGPKASLYLTLFGILAGFLSTFWNFGYTRTALKMQSYLDSPPGLEVPKIKKQQVLLMLGLSMFAEAPAQRVSPGEYYFGTGAECVGLPRLRHQVVDMVTRGIFINMTGLAATLAGVQALVGMLVAKTLQISSYPFMAAASGANYNPVVALDVFLVQAATNTLLGHFFSLACSLWLLHVVGEGQGLRFQREITLDKLKQMAEASKLPELPNAPGASGRQDESFRTNTGKIIPTMTTRQAGSPRSSGFSAGSFNSSSGGGSSSSVSSGGGSAATSGSGTASTSGSSTGGGAGRSRAPSSPAGPSAPPSPGFRSTPSRPIVVAADFTAAAPPSPSADPDAAVLSPSPRWAIHSANLAAGVSSGFGDSRPLLMPTAHSLSYLDGTLPGDYAFDPLGLFDPANGNAGVLSQRWLHTAEVVHGRWAMLGAAGCLAPEYLAHEKVIPKATGVLWFKTGFFPPAGTDYEFHLPVEQLFLIQMVLMGAVESFRLAEYLKPGSLVRGSSLPSQLRWLVSSTELSPSYPGGLMFNPLGLGERPAGMAELQTAEIKHGRLAMVAMLGFAAQAVVTGRGPYGSYVQHAVDPVGHNVLTNLSSIMAAPPPVAAAALGHGHHGH